MPTPIFLFAPGAGASSRHPWMQYWANLLREIGRVETIDYPYMQKHRKRPDPLPRLVAAHHRALVKAKRKYGGPIILIGKSMGARVGCHLALEIKVRAIICLGYPLCGAGDRSKLRDEVLLKLMTPILFVQGTRDRLCPLDLLDVVRSRMKAVSQLEVVNDGDHSLCVAKRTLKANGESQADVDARVLRHIKAFVKHPRS